ncbi:tetratricopeptide repeat protein, partial [Pseudorhodoplanes sp.]|uniref:tetratricopeptide repeat protein n=1 Tax=Pseudorhodoplanes sp. TaxID=1934341 RepID=UPI002B7E51F9
QAALADCAESLKHEQNAAAYDGRGFVYLKLGEWDLAISDYTAALRLDPKLATALYGRGLAHSRKGLAEQASQDHAAAQNLAPDIADVFARAGFK